LLAVVLVEKAMEIKILAKAEEVPADFYIDQHIQ
jgi:hypothetical protein